ncbi:MAG TPA: heavy metal-binding domain-containing protein [Nitrospirales bacterium]
MTCPLCGTGILPGKICLGCGYDPSKPEIRPRAKPGPPPPRPVRTQSFRNPARSEKKTKSKLKEQAPPPTDITDEIEDKESADAHPAAPPPAPVPQPLFTPPLPHPPIAQRAQLPDETVQVTTQAAFEGHRIVAYRGLVVSAIAIRVGEPSELWAEGQDIRRLSGGPLGLRLRKAIDVAIADLKMEAIDRRANAVLGLRLEFLPVQGNMAILTAMGTAVILES